MTYKCTLSEFCWHHFSSFNRGYQVQLMPYFQRDNEINLRTTGSTFRIAFFHVLLLHFYEIKQLKSYTWKFCKIMLDFNMTCMHFHHWMLIGRNVVKRRNSILIYSHWEQAYKFLRIYQRTSSCNLKMFECV